MDDQLAQAKAGGRAEKKTGGGASRAAEVTDLNIGAMGDAEPDPDPKSQVILARLETPIEMAFTDDAGLTERTEKQFETFGPDDETLAFGLAAELLRLARATAEA